MPSIAESSENIGDDNGYPKETLKLGSQLTFVIWLAAIASYYCKPLLGEK